jgi:transcriptional regulator with XRE-family HTH domain
LAGHGSPPLFAGKALRALRTRRALRQADMAQALGISASYLSQLENDERPLTAGLVDALGATFPVDWADLAPPAADELAEALRAALADPHLAASNPSAPHALTGPPSEQIERLARQFPDLARQVVQLHGLYTQTRHRLDMMDDTIGASLAAGGRLPWEEARDWFHQANNYVDTIDRGAEELAARIGGANPRPTSRKCSTGFRGRRLGGLARGGPVRRYDPERRVLTLDSIQPLESSRFQLAYQVCVTALADEIASIVDAAPCVRRPRAICLRSGSATMRLARSRCPTRLSGRPRARCATTWTACASRSTPASSRPATASRPCNARRRAAFRCSSTALTWPAT